MRRSRFGFPALLGIVTLASLGAELPPGIPVGEDFGVGRTDHPAAASLDTALLSAREPDEQLRIAKCRR